MELENIELKIPKQMKQYVQVQDTKSELLRNAMMLYPAIKECTISHGKAAEILGINKLDLIALYGSMGLPYFDMSAKELEEDLKTFHNMKEVVG